MRVIQGFVVAASSSGVSHGDRKNSGGADVWSFFGWKRRGLVINRRSGGRFSSIHYDVADQGKALGCVFEWLARRQLAGRGVGEIRAPSV